MMRLLQLKNHWTPEEAYNMLLLLDDLRDSLWLNYRDDIIQYCRQHTEKQSVSDLEDDTIPF